MDAICKMVMAAATLFAGVIVGGIAGIILDSISTADSNVSRFLEKAFIWSPYVPCSAGSRLCSY